MTCEGDSNNLYATITLFDNDKVIIGSTSDVNNGMGPGINDNAPLALYSKLPLTLVVTGEQRGDYIQFAYGGAAWTSSTADGEAKCVAGAWDPADNTCLYVAGGASPSRLVDCWFPC
jgi:hypothetical protein